MDSISKFAFISVDNTRTFEDKTLNELYVPEGEEAASASKKVADICRTYGILTINVLEEHPRGHISLAANYKKVRHIITYDEVKEWTEEENEIGDRAEFSLEDLKKFLSEVGSQVLRPDHSIKGSEGVDLNEPLQETDFDLKIVKGTNPAREAYSGFDETSLHDELQKRGKETLFIGGVATDYCSGKTASDGIDEGYSVYVITPAVRGVVEKQTAEMIGFLKDKGVEFIDIPEFEALVKGVEKQK